MRAPLVARLRQLEGDTLETAVVALVLFLAAFFGLRVFGVGSSYWSSVLVLGGIYVLLALGLNVVVGYAGLLDLGYAGFWAIGAYATALVTGKAPFHPFELSIWWAIPVAVVAVVLSGMFLGVATLRVRGDYLAIVTLGFGEIVRILANSWDSLTNGPAGITNIPHPVLGGLDFGLDPRPYIGLLCVLIGVMMVAISRLWNSRIGRSWMAVRTDEDAAEAMGVPSFRMKLLAFATGAATAGLAGVLYASYVAYITPGNFVITVAILILAAVVLGGMGRMSGVVLGALGVVTLPEVFRDFEQGRFLIFGAVLVVMMIVRPQGLLPARARKYKLDALPETPAPIAPGQGLMVPPVAGGSDEASGSSARLLECRDVVRRFGGLTALNGVSFGVPRGAIFAIIGPNGAGKSTLFDLIAGMRPPNAGQIWFDGRSLAGLAPHDITRLGIARTFQLIRLFGASSVAENVLVGGDAHPRASALDAILRTPRQRRAEHAALEAARDILDFCGIRSLANEAAGNLSYGDQRRVEIARALATRPRLLLLDEPAAGMNPREKYGLMALIRAVRDSGITVVIIEHDMSMIMTLSDEVLVLDHGVVIADDLPERVSRDATVVEAYLGADVA
jgi:branched-chain amino acid transport system permease protein